MALTGFIYANIMITKMSTMCVKSCTNTPTHNPTIYICSVLNEASKMDVPYYTQEVYLTDYAQECVPSMSCVSSINSQGRTINMPSHTPATNIYNMEIDASECICMHGHRRYTTTECIPSRKHEYVFMISMQPLQTYSVWQLHVQ